MNLDWNYLLKLKKAEEHVFGVWNNKQNNEEISDFHKLISYENKT